jgi:transposase InsO family protein
MHNESYQIYGAPKITVVLRQLGHRIAEKTVGVYMKELELQAIYVKPYTKTTLNSDFSTSLKNILERDFVVSEANAVWCIDLTYIYTVMEGFVYLTSIIDLYSRKIISWTLSRSMKVEEVPMWKRCKIIALLSVTVEKETRMIMR